MADLLLLPPMVHAYGTHQVDAQGRMLGKVWNPLTINLASLLADGLTVSQTVGL